MKNGYRRNDQCSIVITSSSLTDDHIEVLKQGDTFGVFDGNGDILSLRTGSQGLYHGGTRFLSRFRAGYQWRTAIAAQLDRERR